MVLKIDDNGYIKFVTLGGWCGQVLLAQQVTITTSSGKTYHGVIGSTPPHILTPEARQKPMDIKDMYIDLGVDSKEEVESLGIRPGDMITTYIEYCKMVNEKYLLAKAWDDCIGCAVAIEVLHHLKDENHSNIVYGVGTVQEDVGCSGALTTSQMINSSIVFALDVGLAGDVPGVTNQIQVTGGATDASKIHLVHDGALAMSVGIASRYIHSHTSMIHRDDYENTVKLLTEVVRRLDKEVVNEITFES